MNESEKPGVSAELLFYFTGDKAKTVYELGEKLRKGVLNTANGEVHNYPYLNRNDWDDIKGIINSLESSGFLAKPNRLRGIQSAYITTHAGRGVIDSLIRSVNDLQQRLAG